MAEEVAVALGDETPRRAAASTNALRSDTTSNNTSSIDGREIEGVGIVKTEFSTKDTLTSSKI